MTLLPHRPWAMGLCLLRAIPPVNLVAAHSQQQLFMIKTNKQTHKKDAAMETCHKARCSLCPPLYSGKNITGDGHLLHQGSIRLLIFPYVISCPLSAIPFRVLYKVNRTVSTQNNKWTRNSILFLKKKNWFNALVPPDALLLKYLL